MLGYSAERHHTGSIHFLPQLRVAYRALDAPPGLFALHSCCGFAVRLTEVHWDPD
jgi:hypothetical protein